MSIKINTAALLLGSAFLLSACSGDGTASDQDETNQTVDENQTDTSPDNNEKTSSEDNSGEDRNTDGGNEEDAGDKSGATDNDTSSENEDIQQQDYDSSKEAAAQIEGYEKVDQTNIELGHGIKGLQEGAAGHEYLYWNEGRWLIKVDFPTDPQYKVDGYEGVEDMAKKVLDYLEKNYLPAPDDKGVITINGFKEHPETVVKWQEGKTVYTITSKEKEPFSALDTAVESN
ncbi:hypothetical protein FHE72_05445 [Rossellomorea vietnamensis]|uniref:Lipoprotein n=1 Tax=Rossellomorea vietnamensis TaxID=218284 RepID=A0A6I6UQ08_9BACI|nr:hypothetical protein [Rossellomorea vietnamensis]QHE60550.1 hypothetical protein FHE72_05445 [Rossellomorea vietnamensis]